MADQPFSVYLALDGPDLDGLIASAGILRFDWPERKFYIKHFDGISSGHNPSLAPNGKLALCRLANSFFWLPSGSSSQRVNRALNLDYMTL